MKSHEIAQGPKPKSDPQVQEAQEQDAKNNAWLQKRLWWHLVTGVAGVALGRAFSNAFKNTYYGEGKKP